MSNEYKDWEIGRIADEKEWVQKYPFLHIRDIDGTIDTESKFPMMGLEIPFGWYELFFQMCDDIKDLVPEDFYFLQVKEKYNNLVCYPVNSTPEVDAILDKYADIAYYVCAVCGAPANKATIGYIASFCDRCAKDKIRHLKSEQLELAKISSFKNEWDRYLERIK